MADLLKIAPQIDTPYAVLACIILGGVAIYAFWAWSKYKGMSGVTDSNARVKMYRDYLGRYTPEVDNLRVDHKVELIDKQIRFGLIKFGVVVGACVFLISLIIVAVVIVARQPASAGEPSQQKADEKSVLKSNISLLLARLDNYGGNALVHRGGDKFTNGDVYRVMNHLVTEPEMAYPVISFDLAKSAPGGTIKLNRTRLNWMPLERELAAVTGHIVDNFKPPLTFLSKLHRKQQRKLIETSPTIKIGADTTDGLITFSDESPVRKCRLEFEGEPGLYLVVSVELDMQDVVTGRKETVKSDKPVFIVIPQPE